MKKRTVPRTACMAAGMVFTAASLAQPAYKVLEVPVYTDPQNTTVLTYARAVNRSGQTAALLYQQLGGTAAFHCTRVTCTFVPPLGQAHHGGPSSEDINDTGWVVGSSPYQNLTRGYVFDGAGSLNVGAFDEGWCGGCDLSSYAHGINNLGQVVGEAETDNGSWRAFVWQAGAMQKLGTLGGGMSAAYAINDSGAVAGHAQLPGGAWHAFLHRNGKMRDLGTLGGAQSWAYDVNSARQVVGCSDLPGEGLSAAFVYREGAMQALPTLGGTYACAVSGQPTTFLPATA